MNSEEEFFAEMQPQIAQVIGVAVMQLLVDGVEVSRETIAEMIEVLYQEGDADLVSEMAIDVLRLPKE